MAAPKTRVTRTSNGGDFADDGQDHLNLGSDVALVGDPGDGANIIADESNDANWDAPEDDKDNKQRPNGKTDREPADEPEFDEEDSRLAYTESGEQDDDTPRGNARRARRNAARKRAQLAAQQENEELRQRVEQLTGVVTRLATGQQGLAVNTLDAQVSTLQGQLRVVDDEMANAIKNSDGDTYARAQRLRDEIVGRLYAAKTHRDQMAGSGQEGAPPMNGGGPVNGQQQQQPRPQAPDPRVLQYFDRFCDRYDWFDPESSDAKANIVRAVDAELVADGYQRHTPVFWRQLERRLAEDYGLKPGQSQDEGGDDEHEDSRPGREPVTARRQNGSGRPPTNGGRSTASGRAAGFRLTDIQTNILREEGLLDENLSDADKAKRQRIVDKWKRGATADRRGAQS